MSRSNYDKPFYVDVGTSVVAIRCASNHDVIVEYDYVWVPSILQHTKELCDRMNKEVEIGKPRRNCDVGTASDMAQRFTLFCQEHRNLYKCRDDCPLLHRGGPCEFEWSQMPYKKGGVE